MAGVCVCVCVCVCVYDQSPVSVQCMYRENFSEEIRVYVKIPHTARDQIHEPQIFQQKTSLFLHIH